MSSQVLVAYATKHGSTGRAAARIGERLREHGLTVDVVPAADVRGLAGYEYVVLGSAVYMFRWQEPALDFLKRFESELRARPTWLFSVGPTGGSADADQKMAEVLATQPEAPGEAGKLAARVGARQHRTFGGAITDEMRGLLERWMPRGDWQDPDAIRAWADQIAHEVAGIPEASTAIG